MSNKNENVLDKLKNLFHIPITDAAKIFGICETNFKKLCRLYGINRWPYRKIKSINTKISKYRESSCNNNKKLIEQNIVLLEQKKNEVINNTGIKIKSNNFYDILLFDTNFFDTTAHIKEFKIIDGLNLYTVKFGVKVTCSCKNLIIDCDHLKFIMKRVFNQKEIKLSITNEDIKMLEISYEESDTNYNCRICYTPVLGHINIYFFPKLNSYGHQRCINDCLNIIDNLKLTSKYQHFIQNIKFMKIQDKEYIFSDLINDQKRYISFDYDTSKITRLIDNRKRKLDELSTSDLDFDFDIDNSSFTDYSSFFNEIDKVHS